MKWKERNFIHSQGSLSRLTCFFRQKCVDKIYEWSLTCFSIPELYKGAEHNKYLEAEFEPEQKEVCVRDRSEHLEALYSQAESASFSNWYINCCTDWHLVLPHFKRQIMFGVQSWPVVRVLVERNLGPWNVSRSRRASN